jgi:SNF2 family DNA or RNA helicase
MRVKLKPGEPMRKLMNIQIEDSDRMASEGDLPNYSLAGTGKTLSTLEAFKKAGHKRGLVLCPPIAVAMWEEEIKSWLGADVQVLKNGGTTIRKAADFVVCAFDTAKGTQRPYIYKAFDEGAMILDEAHYLRRYDSKRTCAVFGNRTDGAGGFSEKFDQVWSLTGNPIYRHHDDLWSQLAPLFPDVLDQYGCLEYEDFVRNFCVAKLKKHHPNMEPRLTIIRSQNEPIINKILYKDIRAIRRLEAPDLPELVTSRLFPAMGVIPSEYAKLVNKMSEGDLLKALVSTDKDDEYMMQQVWQAVALAKVKSGSEYIAECVRTAPVLVGVWNSSVGEAYLDALNKMGVTAKRVYGATPQSEREAIRDAFNNGDIDCIIGQMQAMGVSWNLQKASNRVVIAQDHFSPSVIEQFYKRVYRTGQKNKTYLDFFTSKHPLDMAIEKIRRQRQRSQEKSLG